MKITLSPTGRFESLLQHDNRVLCRIWEGTTEGGAKVIAHIPLIGLHNDAPPAEQEAWTAALREVKAERQLQWFDIRMAI